MRFKEFLIELTDKAAAEKFLWGDCGAFAVALQDKIGGEIYGMVRGGKVLHVFLKTNGKNYDVKGARSTFAMAMSTVGSTEGFTVEGPYSKDKLPVRKFSKAAEAAALEYINTHMTLFK